MTEHLITSRGITTLRRMGVLATLLVLTTACDQEPAASLDALTMRTASTGVAMVGAGDGTTCAVLEGSEARCWGQQPIVVDGAVVEVRTSGEQGVALMADGTVRAWGSIPADSCAGASEGPELEPISLGSQPTVVELAAPAVQVAVGSDFACVRRADGGVQCWGNDACGQLGHGDAERVGDDEPLGSGGDVELGEPAIDLTAGAHHACAVLQSGAVRCWGSDTDGQLGHGPDEVADAPVSLGAEAVSVVAGLEHTCALLESGSVRCWGSNVDGQLGYGVDVAPSDVPAQLGDVPLGGRAVELAAGARHTCARLAGGALRCWGNNDLGQLGLGHTQTIGDDETPDSIAPVDLGQHEAVALYAGTTAWTTFVVLDYGGLRGWGHNDAGQLGLDHTLTLGDDLEEPPGELPDILVDDVDDDDL